MNGFCLSVRLRRCQFHAGLAWILSHVFQWLEQCSELANPRPANSAGTSLPLLPFIARSV
jgi:hypothetical protein